MNDTGFTKEEMAYQDENFYFIAGYTPGGAPYGITWEEAAGLEAKPPELNKEQIDEELPFYLNKIV